MNQQSDTSQSPAWWVHVLPLCLYTLLSLIMTYPLILHLRSHVAGAGGDAFTFVWNLWWVKKALLDPDLSVFYTDYLYYPTGVSLAFHSLSILNGVLSMPLQPLLGVVGAHNVMILLGFVLAGWGAYLLAFELTRHRAASLLAGVAFGFSPYHFSNAMVDLNIASIQFIPFTLLFLVRWRKQGGYLNPSLAGFFLGLTALCCWYYLLFTALAAFLLGIVWTLRSREWGFSRCSLIGWICFAAVTAAAISPVLIPMMRATGAEQGFVNPGHQEAYSADLLAYLVPSPYQPLLRGWVTSYYVRLTGNIFENTVTLGFVVLFLAVCGIWGRHRLAEEDRVIWIVLGLSSFVLSLGPTLQIAGRIVGSQGYLPYRWLIQELPLVSHARIPSRFAVLVTCSASMLAAYGFRDLLESRTLRGVTARKTVVGLLVFVVVIAEFWVQPFPTRDVPVPEFFEELAGDGEDYSILGFPMDWAGAVLGMYYQTTHEKRIMSGFVARSAVGAEALLRGRNEALRSYGILVQNRVRYIVLFTPTGIDSWHRRVINVFSEIPWLIRLDVKDTDIIVHQVLWPGDIKTRGGDTNKRGRG